MIFKDLKECEGYKRRAKIKHTIECMFLPKCLVLLIVCVAFSVCLSKMFLLELYPYIGRRLPEFICYGLWWLLFSNLSKFNVEDDYEED